MTLASARARASVGLLTSLSSCSAAAWNQGTTDASTSLRLSSARSPAPHVTHCMIRPLTLLPWKIAPPSTIHWWPILIEDQIRGRSSSALPVLTTEGTSGNT